MGAARHLALLPDLVAKTVVWPVPFADGIPMLLQHRGTRVVMLASGDPFWFGAGSVLAAHLEPVEWQAFPASSVVSLVAAAMGWPIETTHATGLHAAPFARLKPHLAPLTQIIATLRDGDAVIALSKWLTDQGFGDTSVHIFEALGGPRERIRQGRAADMAYDDIAHPVTVALKISGDGDVLPLAAGRPDKFFENDGQITKRPMRALTLSALAPKPFEHLWDIGGGSGSISIEWLLCHPTTRATVIEIAPERAARIADNAAQLGVDRLQVITGAAPDALSGLPLPDAVFIGGGISQAMLAALWDILSLGTRIVANGVTLEAETLIAQWHAEKGGDVLRIDLAQAAPLGRKRGWKASYPVVQWTVTR